MNTFTIVDYNFKAPEDISIGASYTTLEKAFEVALSDVVGVNGKNITLHNAPKCIEGDYTRIDSRLTNNNSLGTPYGISYYSNWGNYPCSRMIMKREVKD